MSQPAASNYSLVSELPTPALVVDSARLDHNLAALAAARPGRTARPHVKAHKCTALAQRQLAVGHDAFTCATPREMIGMARAGLGADLLLANEVIDPFRLEALAALDARVTIAVDSPATIAAAAAAGLRECLVDINVGLPRAGCSPADAGRLADDARNAGLSVRGVMGYEGHTVGIVDRVERTEKTATAMAILAQAHSEVGGEIVSAGATGTFDINSVATEIQAGSYALMDSAYDDLGLPFVTALEIIATVISVSPSEGYAVADAGLKALGMDHGNPRLNGYQVWFCSDEHITFGPDEASLPAVGDRVAITPAHVDPTVAYHETLFVTEGERVVEDWAVVLRGW